MEKFEVFITDLFGDIYFDDTMEATDLKTANKMVQSYIRNIIGGKKSDFTYTIFHA
jgi:hypothetical protein